MIRLITMALGGELLTRRLLFYYRVVLECVSVLATLRSEAC